MIIVAGYLSVDPQQRDRYVEEFADLVARARRAPGCIDVAVSGDVVDPGRVTTLEIWQTQEHVDAFRARADPPETGIEVLATEMAEYVVDHTREPFARDVPGSAGVTEPAGPAGDAGSGGSFLGSVVLPATDTVRAAAFWSAALGYVAQEANPDFLTPPGWAGDRDPAGHGPTHVHVDGSDRQHLDLWIGAGASLDDEVERLVGLGATRVDWDLPEDAQHVVLADPEGTLFCVCR